MMEPKCGLLGRRLGHSYSPQIHQWGNYSYDLFEKEPEELEDFLKSGAFSGLNVTIPYKKAVIPYCAQLSPIARQLGAVNTIVRRPDGSLLGHNTDYHGFACLLKSSGISVAGKKCLVLGSGGASNTVTAVLEEQGAQVMVISRSGADNYTNLSRHSDTALIVNATPVGMYPNNGSAPVSLDGFPKLEGVLDLIYNPARTQLLLDAEARGLAAKNGLPMLIEQARESALWFTGAPISQEAADHTLNTIARQNTNLVLIGMPGCGKTTLAQKLSPLLGNRQVVDADRLIEEKAGKSIPEIFAEDGEGAFRALETQVLREVGKGSGQIIATGGGCVTRTENYNLLRQNGVLVWIQRDVDRLPTGGRPLSQSGKLHAMYRERAPLYRRFADFTVSNDGPLDRTLAELSEYWENWFREDTL